MQINIKLAQKNAKNEINVWLIKKPDELLNFIGLVLIFFGLCMQIKSAYSTPPQCCFYCSIAHR
jgi:hypothetical protein